LFTDVIRLCKKIGVIVLVNRGKILLSDNLLQIIENRLFILGSLQQIM